jgi:hypothetical protein
VRERDLARAQDALAADDHPGVAGRVVRRPERAAGHERAVAPELAGDRVDAGHLERLCRRKRRQDAGQGAP